MGTHLGPIEKLQKRAMTTILKVLKRTYTSISQIPLKFMYVYMHVCIFILCVYNGKESNDCY